MRRSRFRQFEPLVHHDFHGAGRDAPSPAGVTFAYVYEGTISPSVESNGATTTTLANPQATIQVKNSGLTRAIVLDANGNPRGTLRVRRTGSGLEVDLPRDALYVALAAK